MFSPNVSAVLFRFSTFSSSLSATSRTVFALPAVSSMMWEIFLTAITASPRSPSAHMLLHAAKDCGHPVHGLGLQRHHLFCLIGAVYTVHGLRADIAHIVPDLPRRPGGIVRQLADLLGYHGESPACRACAGRLDGGVQRQQIRLLRDLRDRSHKRVDGLGLFAQGVDIRPHFLRYPGGRLSPFSQQLYDFHTLRDHALRLFHQLSHLFDDPADILYLVGKHVRLVHAFSGVPGLSGHAFVDIGDGQRDIPRIFVDDVRGPLHLPG